MSSAICFILDQSKTLLFGNGLNLIALDITVSVPLPAFVYDQYARITPCLEINETCHKRRIIMELAPVI